MSGRSASLLDLVHGLLERTYRMRSGVTDAGRFVIGDRGLRELYGNLAEATAAGSDSGDGARTLVRETAGGLRVCVYYPDRLVQRLERFPPQRGLHEDNVDAFATLVEELDHLLFIAARARHRRTVRLFELELHANVSKHLVLSRFLVGSRSRIDEPRRLWLRHHVFLKQRYCDQDTAVRARYADARRWALRFVDALPRIEAVSRVRTLRRFHDAACPEKLRLIENLAAA